LIVVVRKVKAKKMIEAFSRNYNSILSNILHICNTILAALGGVILLGKVNSILQILINLPIGYAIMLQFSIT